MDQALQRRIGELFQQRWESLGFEGLLPEEQDAILLWELSAEVSNGSFDQYLTNSSGDHAEDALAALERLEAAELADTVRRVLDAIPQGWCADRWRRCERVRAMPDRWEVFGALTEEWYEAAAAQEAAGERSQEQLHAAYQRHGLLT